MHVQPQNTVERVFAIAVVVFGLVCFSYLVGSITGSLSQLRSMADTSQIWKMRRFLSQNNVPKDLAIRIEKYLDHKCAQLSEKMRRESVPILKFLSKELDGELQASLTVPHFRVHPLFLRLEEKSSLTLHRLALQAIGHGSYAALDVVFVQDEKSTQMMIPIRGQCQYLSLRSGKFSPPEIVDSGEDWIAEQVLWLTHWRHKGTLSAVTAAEFVTMGPSKFADIVCRNPSAFSQAATYAHNFAEWFSMQDTNGASDIFQGEDISSLIQSFLPPEEAVRRLSKASTICW